MNDVTQTARFEPDELDRVLTDFFRSQVPDPFPPWRSPAAAAAEIVPVSVAEGAARAEPSRRGGRAVLAASVALLVGACWYLSSPVPAHRPPRADQFPSAEAEADRLRSLPPELRPPAKVTTTGRQKR
jgi:hypothetical protein